MLTIAGQPSAMHVAAAGDRWSSRSVSTACMVISACRKIAATSHLARFDAVGSVGLVFRIAMTSADLGYKWLVERSISRGQTHLGLCEKLIYA